MNQLAFNIGDAFNSPFGKNVCFHSVCKTTTLGDLVSLIIKSSLTIAGLLVLFLFIFAGFSIMMGAGSDNPEQSAKGKKAATSAVIGFVIIITAYLIIRIIEVMTGSNFITQPGI